jgi:hypothetical protein
MPANPVFWALGALWVLLAIGVAASGLAAVYVQKKRFSGHFAGHGWPCGALTKAAQQNYFNRGYNAIFYLKKTLAFSWQKCETGFASKVAGRGASPALPQQRGPSLPPKGETELSLPPPATAP